MVTLLTTSTWKQIDLPVLSSVELTTAACELSRAQWPNWAASSTKFSRIVAYCPHPAGELNSTLPSGTLAVLLTERIDPKDAPKIFNYNVYLIAETTDGMLFQSPPIIPADPTHHSSSPSTWFNKLGSPV
ncbi:MAG TPA: hypothetical protein VKG67_02480 [Gallionellaceae bacterium]|nr:hypothetical protein [Gallionellaceae bacterium]